MSWKKASIIVGIVLVLAAVVAANLYFRRDTGLSVNAEGVRARDLEAIVSASGKIQPKRQVNVSANTTGRVTRVAVEEASTFGWDRYAGPNGAVIGIRSFGLSAQTEVVQRHFGFTPGHIVSTARQQIEH